MLLKGHAAYGYCASKSETYDGFKGNIVINSKGIMCGITLTAANIDERESLRDIIENIREVLIADKGLLGEDYQQQIQRHTGINWQIPSRSNLYDVRGKACNGWLIST